MQAAELAELEEADPMLVFRGGEAAREWGMRIKAFRGLEKIAPPAGLAAELRPYQRQGLDWLQFLREYDLAGILADDMGLGKTVQALGHLLIEKESGRADRPSLVVAPTSLMFNWRREAERFAPSLKVLLLQGPDRRRRFDAIRDHALVLTTYPLLSRDRDALCAGAYHLLILDEAQAIKNPRSQSAQAARSLQARHRLCLTGTPLENHLGELWSLFDFLMPEMLGGERRFRRLFRTPIERNGDEHRQEQLRRRVAPFLLRRTKEAVASELPPKTEILREVPLASDQRDLYETLRLSLHGRVRREVERKGLARSGIIILDALLKLRQVCCDPRLVSLESARNVKNSAKLELLMTLLPELLDEERRVLLFSQFTSMLALIEEELMRGGLHENRDFVKLTATPLAHRGWGAVYETLCVGDHDRLVGACASAFVPPPDRRQLDLFQDSTALLLEEEIRRALVERRTDRAREQVAHLMQQDPRHRHLRGFLRLIQVIDDSDTASSEERLPDLLAIEPRARELLGYRDRDFLAPLWSALAEALSGRAFDPGAPRLHASFAWARARRWEAVREVVEAESDWRGEPTLLLAHAEACWHRRDRGAARRDWRWLCWEHPLEAERVFASPGLPDRRLSELWKGFSDLDPPLDIEDFPAWLLLQEPAAAYMEPDSVPADERGVAYSLLRHLVTGDADIELRRELSQVHPQLLRMFLAQKS